MPAPYAGGHAITGAEWLAPLTLQVRFASTWGTQFLHQLYAGRCLIGVTRAASARVVVGQLQPSRYPQHLQLLAVAPGERETDYGAQLPERPYNRVNLRFSASAWPSDSEFIDVFAGTAPGSTVDANNRIERILYDTDRQYQAITRPLDGSGQWNFEVKGRDRRPPDGNLGTALALDADILAHPPDVDLQSDGSRFTLTIAAQQATIGYSVS